MKFTEETLKNWTKRASDTEHQKIENVINMVKSAINNHTYFHGMDIDVFTQGSYPNNTNVKLDSDVDVNIMLKDVFFLKYPDEKSRDDYGFSSGTIDYYDYRKEVLKALRNKFSDDVTVGNKSFKIDSNTYRVMADVVPSYQFRNYLYDDNTDEDNYIEGIQFFARDKSKVINYPKVHIRNGIQKNSLTQRRFKRLVRIFKRIRNKMIEDNVSVSNNISSFLLESLVWNLPNKHFIDNETWTDRLGTTIRYLYEKTKTEKSCKKWEEVSEQFHLFHHERKWSVSDVNKFLVKMWNYLEYNNE